MRIKNGNLYFDDNNYLQFDNIKFIGQYGDDYEFTGNKYMMVPRLYFDHETSKYMVYIDFVPADKRDSSISESHIVKLYIVDVKQMDKMSLMCSINEMMSLIYDVMCLFKQHGNIVWSYYNLPMNIYFMSDIYNMENNLVMLYERSIRIFNCQNNPIRYDNTILVMDLTHRDIGIPYGKIIVKDNVVYTHNDIIIYPGSYNCNSDRQMPDGIIFSSELGKVLLEKSNKIYSVSYYAAPSLISKFVNNIELFDNVDNFVIKNEFDLFRYV